MTGAGKTNRAREDAGMSRLRSPFEDIQVEVLGLQHLQGFWRIGGGSWGSTRRGLVARVL